MLILDDRPVLGDFGWYKRCSFVLILNQTLVARFQSDFISVSFRENSSIEDALLKTSTKSRHIFSTM